MRVTRVPARSASFDAVARELANGGDGVAIIEDIDGERRAVFVRGAAPGDELRLSVDLATAARAGARPLASFESWARARRPGLPAHRVAAAAATGCTSRRPSRQEEAHRQPRPRRAPRTPGDGSAPRRTRPPESLGYRSRARLARAGVGRARRRRHARGGDA